MTRRLVISLVVALGMGLSLGLFGCGSDDPTTPGVTEFETVTDLGDTYFTDYTTPSGLPVNVVASAVYENLFIDGNAANDPYILDWRSPTHFDLGHIEGAVNVGPVTTADFAQVLAGIPAGKTVLNVCYTGQTASYATSWLNMLGYDAQNLKFGMCGWTSDTNVNLNKWNANVSHDYNDWMVTTPFTSTAVHTPPSLSTGKSVADEILNARAVSTFNTGWKAISKTALYDDIVAGNGDDYYIVNYFNLAPYEGGHIPGAIRYQPKNDLKFTERLMTLPTDKKIVVYCFTGQTSAQVVAYLNAIGYDAYTLTFGVNGLCYDNPTVCTTRYHDADNDYPVVGTAM